MGGHPGRDQRAASKKKGRACSPSYALIDSQSVKTQYASEERGIDGGKGVKGHKRHIVVDTLGRLLPAQVHAANLHDTVGACEVLRRAAVRFVNEKLGWVLHISQRIVDGFAALPKRWIVEQTFAWFGSFRQVSKDFETLTGTAENVIRIAMPRTTLAKCV
ncbi:transposase [Methylomagnum ishizawai]|uniref:transposase n=1 Tax=Methylomagnum ishizawai TaxID=1760988 RepID=UPI001C3400F3|nr:transposase [Methylomagnum ishizawai]BBL76811.1 hypothetical protein MishRS11D_39090 [Methylomagnum ishizawai]